MGNKTLISKKWSWDHLNNFLPLKENVGDYLNYFKMSKGLPEHKSNRRKTWKKRLNTSENILNFSSVGNAKINSQMTNWKWLFE